MYTDDDERDHDDGPAGEQDEFDQEDSSYMVASEDEEESRGVASETSGWRSLHVATIAEWEGISSRVDLSVLQTLDACRCDLQHVGLNPLFDAMKAGLLRSLSALLLSDCGIRTLANDSDRGPEDDSDDDLENELELAGQAPFLRSLTHVDLSYNDIEKISGESGVCFE